ncbi:TcpQ domain-containing protein [Pseudomonas alliivorans]|nr:TcpQ domain-containing protein [Pseudomonas alliivorans]
MRNQFILTVLFLALAGCAATPKTEQLTADQVVDEQMASSAASLSLAQWRLKQTSLEPAASLPKPIAVAPSAPVSVSVPVGASTSSIKAGGSVSGPTPSTKDKLSSSGSKPPVVIAGAGEQHAAKVMPATKAPAVVIAKTVMPPLPTQEPWVLSPSDVTLRRALTKWAKRAGWQLVWDASEDVPLDVTAKFNGDFVTAVRAVFRSLSADVKLVGLTYKDNTVLRVVESGRRAQ